MSLNSAAELVTLNVPPLLFVNVNCEVATSALPLTTNVSPLTELIKELKSTSKVVSAELPTKFISLVPLLYVPPLTKLSVVVIPLTGRYSTSPVLLFLIKISVPLLFNVGVCESVNVLPVIPPVMVTSPLSAILKMLLDSVTIPSGSVSLKILNATSPLVSAVNESRNKFILPTLLKTVLFWTLYCVFANTNWLPPSPVVVYLNLPLPITISPLTSTPSEIVSIFLTLS